MMKEVIIQIEKPEEKIKITLGFCFFAMMIVSIVFALMFRLCSLDIENKVDKLENEVKAMKQYMNKAEKE